MRDRKVWRLVAAVGAVGAAIALAPGAAASPYPNCPSPDRPCQVPAGTTFDPTYVQPQTVGGGGQPSGGQGGQGGQGPHGNGPKH
jgi:hypothetical protein